MAQQHINIPPENHVSVLGGQGWVGLIDTLGTESTIVNAARGSFGKIQQEMELRNMPRYQRVASWQVQTR